MFILFFFASPVDAAPSLTVTHKSKYADYVLVGEIITIEVKTISGKNAPALGIEVNGKKIRNCYNTNMCQAKYIAHASDTDIIYYGISYDFVYESIHPLTATENVKGPKNNLNVLSAEKVSSFGGDPKIYLNVNNEKPGKFDPIVVSVNAASDVGIDHIYFEGWSNEPVCRSNICEYIIRPGSDWWQGSYDEPLHHNLRAKVVDKAGNYSATQTKKVYIGESLSTMPSDTVYPIVSFDNNKIFYKDGEQISFNVSIKEDNGLKSVKIYDNTTRVLLKDCGTNTQCSVTRKANISDGVSSIRVVAQDMATNETENSAIVFVVPEDVINKTNDYINQTSSKYNNQNETTEADTKQAEIPKEKTKSDEVKKEVSSNKTSISNMDVVKSPRHTSVYYIDNGVRRPFVNEQVYKTWYKNFSNVKQVSVEDVEDIPLGKPVSIRPGKALLKFPLNPRVYEVLSDSVMTHIPSEEVAKNKYGEDWNKNVIELPEIYSLFYTVK